MAFRMLTISAVCGTVLPGHAAVAHDDTAAMVLDIFQRSAQGDAILGERLGAAEVGLASTFQALPKNRFGRLEPNHVSQALRGFFSKAHGWTIAGFEQESPAESEPVPVAIRLYEQLNSQRRDRGLNLQDLSMLVVLVEDAMRTELSALLQTAFEVNGAGTVNLDSQAAEKVLSTYLALLMHGSAGELNPDSPEVRAEIAEVEADNKEVESLANMPKLALKGTTGPYNFAETLGAAERMLGSLTRWQGWRCGLTKATLEGLVKQGASVPLPAFYLYGSTTPGMPFTQSTEYLRQIGGLEEADGQVPRVKIANYMQGPSNCLRATKDLSFCCPNECEHLAEQIRDAVKGPATSGEHLAELLEKLSDVSGSIAQGVDDVNLHGDDFQKMLHAAKPSVCASPSGVAAGAMSLSKWQDGSELADEVELAHYIAQWNNTAPEQNDAPEETVPLPSSVQLRAVVRVAVMLLTAAVALHGAVKVFSKAVTPVFGSDKLKKAKAA